MTAPMLGHAVRGEWGLDPDFLTVNHGSFGATPRVVLAAQDEWRRRMEAQPSRFMNRVLPRALRDAADRLAEFLGARGQDLVFTDNATTGCNAVLRSLRLTPEDEVLVLSHAYGAVRKTVQFVVERAGARLTEAAVPFPDPGAAAIVAAVAAAITSRTRIAVVDHITSGSALVIPLRQVVAACHAAGVPVLVDGAHAPGQVDVDLTELDADWYAGNCHKWLCAPKGSAFLWARPDRQADLHPTVISHGFEAGFLAEFDWTGTRDPTPALCVPAALHFHARLGGPALRQRNRALAIEAAELVAARLNSDVGTSGDQAGAVGLVRLPLARPADEALALAVRGKLMDAGCDAPVHVHERSLWLRLSAFGYNERNDYVRLADLAAQVIRDV